MTGNFLSKWHMIALAVAILAGLSISGCQVLPGGLQNRPGESLTDTANNPSDNPDTKGVAPGVFEYSFGMKRAVVPDNVFLQNEYNDWKAHYVTSDGAGGGWNLRVKRDLGSAYDTVSEGIGYGMLLAVYFQDQVTFDRLYLYCLSHTNNGGLMHWKINSQNSNVSEFDLYVPHGVPYSNTITKKLGEYPYSNIITGVFEWTNVYQADWSNHISYAERYLTNLPNHIPLALNGRKLTSATDADVDIAAALCFASKVWGTSSSILGSRLYVDEAKKMINQIMKLDMHTGWGNKTADVNFFLGNGYYTGGTWGGNDPAEKPGWYPCYFTPAWYRIFYQVTGDSQWNSLLIKMYNMFNLLDTVNGSAGLYPDACDTSLGDVRQTTTASDRQPYSRESFNFYYDAVRVPWRLALDYSWNGESKAQTRVVKMGNFFKGLGNITNIKDGYYIDGTTWSYQYCNSNNVNWLGELNGGLYHSSTFSAMCGTTVLAMGDAAYASNFYVDIVNNKDAYNNPTNPYHYYGNTVRLLSLLYLSGKFIDLYNLPLGRKPAQYTTAGPLTIDLAYVDYGVYGLQHCDFHDRANLFNADGTTRANIGSGSLNATVADEMILGVSCQVNDVNCGLMSLRLREPQVYGNILAKGDVTGHVWMFGNGYFLKNINKDVGSMDFSAPQASFTTGTANINLEPGQTTSLAPGNYGDLTLKGRNKITFSSGTYNINSYNAEPDVTNYMNITNGAPILIFVKGDFNMKSRTKMLNPADNKGADPTKILVVVGSPNTVYIADDVSWRGTLIAPNTSYLNVDICNTDITNVKKVDWKGVTVNGDVFGAIWGKYTVVHQICTINYVPFDWNLAITKGLAKKK